MTIQSEKITIRGPYIVMINLFGWVCCKGLKLSFTASKALHYNPFAFKRGSEQQGRTAIGQIHSTLVCFCALPPSSFTDFSFDSHQEFQKDLKSTLSKQLHGAADPGHCPKKGLETLANRKDDTHWKTSTQAQDTEEQLKT